MRKKCKICGTEVAEEAKFCHKCGASEFDNSFWENTTVLNQPDSLPPHLPPQTSEKKKIGLIIGAAVGAFLLLIIIIAVIASGSNKKNVGQPMGSLTDDKQEISYKLTEGEAAGIAEERIKRFARLESIGIVCDYDPIEVPSDSDGYTMGGEKNAVCSCCKTPEEAKEHLHQYLDAKYDEMFSEIFLYPSPGELYLFSRNDGQTYYQKIKLQSWDNDKIIVAAEKWVEIEHMGNYLFTIEQRDGKYLITDCVEIEEPIQTPETPAQTPEAPAQTPETPTQTSQASVQTPKDDNIRIVLTWTDSSVNLQFLVSIEGENGETQYYQDGNEMRSQSGELLAKVENGALQSTLTLFDARAHYSIRVEDPDYGYIMENRIFGAGGRIQIQKGNTVISDGELALYRSYTGAWFGGVCEVEKGEIKEYDASWISAGMP